MRHAKRILRRWIFLLFTLLLLAGCATAEDADKPVLPVLDAPFQVTFLPEDRLFTVYSGPGKDYLVAANGKAKVSSNGEIRCYGRTEDWWLMVEYEIGENRSRIGYINAAAYQEETAAYPVLAFGQEKGQLNGRTEMTDDPWVSRQKLGNLSGEVTVLARLQTNWAYVEATWKNKPIRAFVRIESLPSLPETGE